MSKRSLFPNLSLRRLLGGAMLGLVVCAGAGACNKQSSPPPETVADDESAAAPGEKRGHKNPCEQPDPEAHIAKMHKCQSEVTAACNTQIYGTATPTKDAICGDKNKMKAAWKCAKETYGDDKDRQRADRKKMKECMRSSGDGPAKPDTTTGTPAGPEDAKATPPPVT